MDMEIELDNHDRFRNTEIFEKIIKFSEEHGKKSFPNFSRDFWKIIYCLIINSGKNKSGFQRVYSLVKPNFSRLSILQQRQNATCLLLWTGRKQ